MPLITGTRLGAYEIQAMLGAGGMGEVYRATDLRLDRSVAIKVLPSELTGDPERRRRLEQEARAIASLSHPNICALFDVGHDAGADYLVMELVEGETLAERISRGPLPLDQLYRFGIEIAKGLDAAHRRGLVHRDLKPGNVMISRSGPKILDFGLAKFVAPEGGALTGESATLRQPMTAEGKIVGTLQYMAPEQLEGKLIDARTDIFALGCVLYEMATGKRPFGGSSSASVIASIMHDTPAPVASLRAIVPAGLGRAIEKCLAKDPDERWQSAGDLADELAWIAQAPAPAEPARQGRTAVIGASAAAVAVAAALVWFLWPVKAPAPRTFRFSLSPPDGTVLLQRATRTELAVSPDGKAIAFVGAEGSRTRLWVQQLDSLTPRPLDGTENAAGPFWSEDGKRLGFFADGKLKIVPADGGAVVSITDANGGNGSWHGSQIAFAEWGPKTSERIQIVNEDGSGRRELKNDMKGWPYWPCFLPDGKHVLFYLNRPDEKNGLYVVAISGGEPRLVLEASSLAQVSSGWDLFYVRDGVLVRQKIDRRTVRPAGEPVTIADGVHYFQAAGLSSFSISADGSVIAFQRHSLPTRLVWVDRNGRQLSAPGEPRYYRSFRLSPDGERLAVDIMDVKSGASNVWLQDVRRDVITRVTSSARGAFSPIWAPDGKGLILSSNDLIHPTNPPQLVYWPFSGAPRLLGDKDGPQRASDITADGKWVIYAVNRAGQYDIDMQSSTVKNENRPLIRTNFSETDGTVSPDGRWMAFASDESGRFEVYVQPFLREGEKIRVSLAGGTEPQWRPDGGELYYVAPDRRLMAARFAGGKVGEPVALFAISSAGMMEFEDFGGVHYQVGHGGERFLVRQLVGERDSDPITVLVNP